VGFQCVPLGSGIFCGAGTVQVGNNCVPTATSPVSCGPGTQQVGSECLPIGGDAGPDGGPDGGVDAGVISGNPVGDDAGTTDARGSESTNFGVDSAHHNAQPFDSIASPLTPAWTAQFDGPASYPLIANGLAIVAVADSQPNIRALDLATGALVWGPILAGASVSLAYDGGRIFALDGNGNMAAYDAMTGHKLWAKSIAQQSFYQSPPVAAGGLVYVDGLGFGGTTSAIDELDGTSVWNAFTFDGSEGTVAVGGGIVYEEESCNQISAFDAKTGNRNWFDFGTCTGGGGVTPAVYQDQVWARDFFGANLVVGLDGSQVGSFAASAPSAFHRGWAFLLSQRVLSAVDIGANTLKWSFAGDGGLCTPAAVAGGKGQVFVGSSTGNVYELDEQTGTQLSVSKAGTTVSCASDNVSMALGSGRLLVPAGNALVAY